MTEYAVDARGFARITLDRPEKRNALNPELLASLRKALDTAAADPSVRVILLRGAGKDFCAGLDLKNLRQSDEVLDHFAAARELADLYIAMRRNPKPIVAAVHGRAIGGGCGLATASDLVLATDSAEFRYPEVNLGFIAAIVLSMLRRIVGEKRAFEIVALGDSIPAASALSLGIVNHVFPAAEFEASVDQYVSDLASKSGSALSLTKDIFYHIDGMTFEAAIHAGLYGNALARMTPDARKGFDQFAGKS
ncbi:MAG: enoyl-CoA hydratase/isomerase family protein [Acidobacteriota bacterium]